MTKEELIALSDLNREDNIKYISSEAQGIAIVLDSDRYAPALCKLERAYICGRRKSENYIADLEKENAELKKKLKEKLKTIADKDLSFVAKFDALGIENAELKERLERAKKIIKELLDLRCSVSSAKDVENRFAIREKAKRFLEEEE